MDCKEIKKLLLKENINEDNYLTELKDILKIYKIYLKYCDMSNVDSFEKVLIDNFSVKYLDWPSKIDFLREKFIKPVYSKDQFSKYLSIKLEDYLKKCDKYFNLEDRNSKISKTEFDKINGYKTSSSIRQYLKNVNLLSDKEVKRSYEKEAKFIENFCNIHEISYDWFMKKMYKNFEDLNLLSIKDIRPKIKDYGFNLKQEDINKLLSILNNSEDTIIKEIKKIFNEKSYIYSNDFLIVLLLNSFEKIPNNEIILELIYFIEQKDISEYFKKYIVSIKAKYFSNSQNDEKAIETLENSFDFNVCNEIELISLLAASYKRIGYKDTDEESLVKSLQLYKRTFELEKSYYSLINILYILTNLDYEKEFSNYVKKWKEVKVESSWWYFISKLEFYMLQNDVTNLKKELNNIIDIKKISPLNLNSTIRELNYYKDIQGNNNVNEAFTLLLSELEKIRKNSDLGKESHLD